jgi:hypothetical protein
MQEAQAGAGEPIDMEINDPNFQPPWQKMQSVHRPLDPGEPNITIHFWHNTQTGVSTGFKFVFPP